MTITFEKKIYTYSKLFYIINEYKTQMVLVSCDLKLLLLIFEARCRIFSQILEISEQKNFEDHCDKLLIMTNSPYFR